MTDFRGKPSGLPGGFYNKKQKEPSGCNSSLTALFIAPGAAGKSYTVFLYSSPHALMASSIGFSDSPSSDSAYSTLGGTSG